MNRSSTLVSLAPRLRAQRAARRKSAGPPDAVEAGIAAHFPDLMRCALQLTGDRARAEDLVQDTCERALRFRHTFQVGGHVRAWLLCIQRNVFISQRRRSKTERRVLEGSGVDPNGWTSLPPAKLVPGLSPPVQLALDDLPEHLNRVVYLVDLGDQSYKDAARIEAVPVGTIMSRLSRGRARLAEVLAGPEAA